MSHSVRLKSSLFCFTRRTNINHVNRPPWMLENCGCKVFSAALKTACVKTPLHLQQRFLHSSGLPSCKKWGYFPPLNSLSLFTMKRYSENAIRNIWYIPKYTVPSAFCVSHSTSRNHIQRRDYNFLPNQDQPDIRQLSQHIQNYRQFSALSSASSKKLMKPESISKTTVYKQMDKSMSRQLSISAKSIVDASPLSFQPYLRLIRVDKPIGTWLLFWPCTWSICLAGESGQLPDLYMLTLFGFGSFLMRGAGCIINDMWDKDYDRKVERTKLRPLASGELNTFQALCFLGLNLSLALGILLQLNWYSVMLGASSMLLVVTYPLMKRYTYWPQAFLGLTLNWGVLLAWTHLHGGLEWGVVPLYVATVVYTMTYDSIYSHQDKYDDLLIGVKSTALKFGDHTKPWLCGFAGVMMSGLLTTGVMCDQTWPYYFAVAATGAHVTYQIFDVDLNNPDDCAAKFRSNSWLGLFLFLGAAVGTWLKQDSAQQDNEEKGTLPSSKS